MDASLTLRGADTSMQDQRAKMLQKTLDIARAGGPATDEKTRAALVDFEAMYLSQMLEHMFAGIEPNPTFGGGPAESAYRSLLIEEYGKIMAGTGGIGVADAMQRELLMAQEAAER
jgi:flagellar protein FlgJ